MTISGTTEDLPVEVEQTAATAALTEALDAVARMHADAVELIAHLADTWDSPADAVRVLQPAERPAVGQRVEAAAA